MRTTASAQRNGRGRHLAAGLMVAALLASACSGPGGESDPYEITVDAGPWIEALGSDDLFVSEPAEDALFALGPASFPALAAAMQREPTQVRVGVVAVLGDLDLPEAVPVLIDAARDPDAELRSEALAALARIGDTRAAETAEAALADPVARVRYAAIGACATLCSSREAFESIAGLALVTDPPAVSAHARDAIHVALRSEDAARAAHARAALESKALPLLRPETEPRQRALAALLTTPAEPARALPWLREAAEAQDLASLRLPAIFALGRYGDEAAIETLVRIKKTASPAMALASCRSLGQMQRRGLPVSDRQLRSCPQR